MLKPILRALGGDLPELVQDPLGVMTRLARDPSGVAPLRIGFRRAFLVSKPDLVRRVLLENFENYDKDTPAFTAVRIVLGRGLLTSSGSFWRRQRRIAQPVFHGESIKRFAPVFSGLAEACAEKWEAAREAGQAVDAGTDMMKTTLMAAAQSLFGEDFSSKAAEIDRVFPIILHEVARRVASIFPLPLWMPTPSNRRLQSSLGSLVSIVDEMIGKRRERLQGLPPAEGTRLDLLTTLMLAKDEETGEAMNDSQLRDEVMTLLIAGHETTANALTWVWVLLDRHPGEQERLRAELKAVTGGRPPRMEDIPHLKRLRMVFLEALRLYPPVWLFDRRALGSDRLGDHDVRAGDLVLFCAYAVHRVPALWQDPEEFRPERFAPGEEEQKNKFAFLPFGAGPRVCMGMAFAMVEAQIILGTLLSRFRIRIDSGGQAVPQPVVTLRPDRRVMLRLEKVE